VLVHTKEVDLCHLNTITVEAHIDVNTRDEAVKFVLFASTDADKPIVRLIRREKCPSKEGY